MLEEAYRRPGRMLQEALRQQARFLPPVAGATSEEMRFMPRMQEYVSLVASHTVSGLRNLRELRTIALAVDALCSDNICLAADCLAQRFKAVEWFEVLVAEKIIPATPKNVETRRLPTSFTTKVTRAFSLKCQRAWVVEPILESVGMLATTRRAIARRATALVESQVLAA